MYEQLDAPLPDPQRYWDKLGIERPDGELSKEDLDRIICAHQMRIPFENIDIYDRGLCPSLAIGDLFEKIIVGNRGGYCFEINALFDALLRDAGVATTSCVGRSTEECGYVYPIVHRGVIACVEGVRYLAEVGFGGPVPACAMPLEDGAEAVSFGQRFRMELRDGSWWHLSYLGREDAIAAAAARGEAIEPLPVLALLDAPMASTDFAVLSYFAATSPDSEFVQHRMLNKRTPSGSVAINDDVLTIHDSNGRQTHALTSREAFAHAAKAHFGIDVPA